MPAVMEMKMHRLDRLPSFWQASYREGGIFRFVRTEHGTVLDHLFSGNTLCYGDSLERLLGLIDAIPEPPATCSEGLCCGVEVLDEACFPWFVRFQRDAML
jgi:hypothetical protein